MKYQVEWWCNEAFKYLANACELAAPDVNYGHRLFLWLLKPWWMPTSIKDGDYMMWLETLTIASEDFQCRNNKGGEYVQQLCNSLLDLTPKLGKGCEQRSELPVGSRGNDANRRGIYQLRADYSRFNANKCRLCGAAIDATTASLDHAVPTQYKHANSLGRSLSCAKAAAVSGNLWALCTRCNMAKGRCGNRAGKTLDALAYGTRDLVSVPGGPTKEAIMSHEPNVFPVRRLLGGRGRVGRKNAMHRYLRLHYEIGLLQVAMICRCHERVKGERNYEWLVVPLADAPVILLYCDDCLPWDVKVACRIVNKN